MYECFNIAALRFVAHYTVFIEGINIIFTYIFERKESMFFFETFYRYKNIISP